jgi:hypothetical protein
VEKEFHPSVQRKEQRGNKRDINQQDRRTNIEVRYAKIFVALYYSSSGTLS